MSEEKKGVEKRAVTEVAEEILKFLRTGETREIREVAGFVHVSKREVREILGYLEKMGLVRENAKITNSGLEFLVKFLDRMDFVKKGVRITEFGLELLELPEGEE